MGLALFQKYVMKPEGVYGMLMTGVVLLTQIQSVSVHTWVE